MTCDVYVLPTPGCDRVWVYPSGVHPGGGGLGYGPVVSRDHHRIEPERRLGKEDELAVILLMEAFTTSG
jgi:hypothetical protein